ncbi:uncharacterized protein DUF397 [Haloactinospora alba]|uniref:Uncharacterized protein DUF397 n=1 Tax=Haloactinospora alba TaxID=405555 RepID=A0A543NAD8_9ACTN|nr:DUF397 domain-containing protein [Haloactinospora alba]TQN28768.1 uncharacterized protein DUF397 [Haloactinospora alba]
MRERDWHKSSYSDGGGGNCVEVRESAAGVAVRDSRNRREGNLSFSASEWRSFLAGVRADRL